MRTSSVHPLSVVLILAVTAILQFDVDPQNSADLLALWLAAIDVAQGNGSQIYPDPNGPFSVLPPSHWVDLARSVGHETAVFPYIYPPLWVWLLAPLTLLMDFSGLLMVMSVINPLLIGLTLILTHRIADSRMSQPLWVGLGFGILIPSTIGVIAWMQNQPQILVAFLVVLAIEREERNASVLGGALMGLAAALKVYPALFAIVWIAQGRWCALGAFVVVGGSLGLLSVAVAGWPLHQVFLSLLQQFYRSAVTTNITYSLIPAFTQIFSPDSLYVVRPVVVLPDPDDPLGGFLVGQIPAVASMVAEVGGLVLAVAGGLLLRRSGSAGRAALWPAIMVSLALVAPLSWSTHYLAPIAFLPMLFDRLSIRAAVAITATVSVFTALILVPWFNTYVPVMQGGQLAGTLGMMAMGAGFVLAWHRSEHVAPRA